MLHRYRESLTHERTALGNRIRGYLREVGLFLVQGLSQESIYVAWLLATRIYQRRQRLSGFCNNKEAILYGASSQGKAKTSGSITDETKLGAVRIFLCWH
ncbi:hypothetical protein [Legionella cincinnatiensis]|uniref:Uncharacterized protein n=1 Tax=Legionella cincinnatiensis TaxID=28085 RepID=A0A378IK05_9GAMM|nr:hypothetical protein [Legionella cincinnatiensis]STX34811.1 Uncharacterised protein [Legionella cincinnatiensis]